MMAKCGKAAHLQQNVSRGFFLCPALPTPRAINQPPYVEMLSQGVTST